MQTPALLATLATSDTPEKMRRHLDAFQMQNACHSRFCTFLREAAFGTCIDEVFALSDRIAKLVVREPLLLQNAQSLKDIVTIDQKLNAHGPLCSSVLRSRVTKELINAGSFVVQNSGIRLSDLGSLLEQCDPEKVHSVRIPFEVSVAYIPIEVAKQICREHPQETLGTQHFEPLLVKRRTLLVTREVHKMLFNVTADVVEQEPAKTCFPRINPLLVVQFINARLAPQTYPAGELRTYLQVDDDGELLSRNALTDFVILVDFLSHPRFCQEVRNTLQDALRHRLDADETLGSTQVKNVFHLVELLEHHEGVIERDLLRRLRLYVERYFAGVTTHSIELLACTRIPFDNLKMRIQIPDGLLEDDFFFEAVQVNAVAGQRSLSSDEALFCYYQDNTLYFLPKLAKADFHEKAEVKTKELTFLLSQNVAQDPIWKLAATLKAKNAIAIAHLLEESKTVTLEDALEVIALAKRAKSPTLQQKALSQIFIHAQAAQEIRSFMTLETLLGALIMLKGYGVTERECSYLSDIISYMTAGLIQTKRLPILLIVGYETTFESDSSGRKFFAKKMPVYKYPRQDIQRLCNDAELKQLSLTIDREMDAEALTVLDGFSTIETLTVTFEEGHSVAPQWLEALQNYNRLQTLRLRGVANSYRSHFAAILQLPRFANLEIFP